MTKEEIEAALDIIEGDAWAPLVANLGRKTVTILADAAAAHLATLSAPQTNPPTPAETKLARQEAYQNGWSDGYAEGRGKALADAAKIAESRRYGTGETASHAQARILGEVAAAILALSASPPAYAVARYSTVEELDAILNKPEPNVVVNADGSCSPAPAVAQDGREIVARWMMEHSYATGHGDTIADLLVELEGQARTRAAKTAPAVAQDGEPREPTGFLAGLSANQKQEILAYRGPESIGRAPAVAQDGDADAIGWDIIAAMNKHLSVLTDPNFIDRRYICGKQEVVDHICNKIIAPLLAENARLTKNKQIHMDELKAHVARADRAEAENARLSDWQLNVTAELTRLRAGMMRAEADANRLATERDEAVKALLTLDKVSRGASVPAEDYGRAYALIAKHDRKEGDKP